jgi:hypoxanthine phosphoribosyltransferase
MIARDDAVGLCGPVLGEIVFGPARIAETVARLAGQIVEDAAGQPILLLGVLKGALFFIADLARALPPATPARIDFLVVSSYGDGMHSSGEVRLLKDVGESLEGKHVVIVEDIVDQGLTLAYLQRLLATRGPASLRSCTLLDKPYRRKVDVSIDYKGLICPDTFIVGYGLDYQERFRHLPYLASLHVGPENLPGSHEVLRT